MFLLTSKIFTFNKLMPIFLIVSRIMVSQNLILNGSFEQKSKCPDTYAQNGGQFEVCLEWSNPSTGWPRGSPDYFNSCAYGVLNVPNNYLGFQNARTGIAYCGIMLVSSPPNDPEFREYIQTKISSPLIAGNCYHFEMYINSANRMIVASDAIQVYFSDTAISVLNDWTRLDYVPQINNPTGNFPDSLNWKLMAGDYLAKGDERFLIIGNFKSNANSDTIFTGGDIPKYPDAYIYVDDVSLTLKEFNCFNSISERENVTDIKIFPQPAKDIVNIETESSNNSDLKICDFTGKNIFREKFIQKLTFSLEYWPAGLYFCHISNDKEVVVLKLIKN